MLATSSDTKNGDISPQVQAKLAKSNFSEGQALHSTNAGGSGQTVHENFLPEESQPREDHSWNSPMDTDHKRSY